ncbi:PREDICTED: uncharacterized protein LOC105366864 [Ceratosolen solmsi marchali]|uniref:Uncharacterized protein LOC105366864 n=1 Tax=Ceratosolen solmsi marchali TaxID=326594 RepID=A0AAJ6YT72_9HYME|nr:PREDICTED: uncharacterized protein LOC105366864 [Ceratosolen solmsi marchali]
MKMSFSLSSLQHSNSSLERVEQTGIRVDRPYNSLTKKRKEPMQEQSTKNYSGLEDSKDDFWAAIRTNYDYIMDTNLIDTCKEANGELAWDEGDVSPVSWGLKEVSSQFSELYSWLQVLQELIYSKEENLLNKSLRVAHTAELRRKAYRRRLFNDQAEKLIARSPSLKEEVAWRIDHLNVKWDLVEQIMAPVPRCDEMDNHDFSADFEHEVKCLRKWLREMEARLQPLNFRVDWGITEIEEKAVEHMVLQRDIEAHGRIVNSVVKLGERVAGRFQHSKELLTDQNYYQQRQQALRIAGSLERRWHLLFLRALEWQCHIETLAARIHTKLVVSHCSSDSDDDEPVTKQPRLSRQMSLSRSSSITLQNENCHGLMKRRSLIRARRQLKTKTRLEEICIVSNSNSKESSESVAIIDPSFKFELSSDSDIPSENRFIDDESYFEDDFEDDIFGCVLSIKPVRFFDETKKFPRKRHSSIGFGDQGTEADIEEAELSEEETNASVNNTEKHRLMMIQMPDPIPITTALPINTTINDSPKRRKTDIDEAALFNTSNRKSKNCATFYFKHMDTDSEIDSSENNNTTSDDHHYLQHQFRQPPTAYESSEEEWTYTSTRMDVKQQQQLQQKKIKLRLDFNTLMVTAKTKKNDNNIDNNIHNDKVAGVLNNNIDGEPQQEEKKYLKVNNSDDECATSKDSIQKLIREVEKLVREDSKDKHKVPSLIFDEDKNLFSPQNHRAKYARIKEWLALNSTLCREGKYTSQYCLLTASETLDSCDASGEYTTGESDLEKQSETSEEDLQSSVVTCRRLDNLGIVSQATSAEVLKEDLEEKADELNLVSLNNQPLDVNTSRVVLRSKRKTTNSPRPWSVSCITQIRKRASLETKNNDPISQFSISETALHQLISTLPTKSASLEATELHVPFNNSTSTLLEETIISHDARIVRNSSLRRRKNKFRKKPVSRKSESGSDSMNLNNQRSDLCEDVNVGNNMPRSMRKSISSRQTRSTHTTTTNMTTTTMTTTTTTTKIMTLVKSGSFSGCNFRQQNSEFTINSDSQSNHANLPWCTIATSSESEENEEPTLAGRLMHTECIDNNYNESALISKQMHATHFNAGDSDTEKNSLGNNSFSDQAWDNYQEKYMSEPYSEAVDFETARHLLEFGDDYSNFLDSQSDCASSLSAVHYKSNVTSEDSDSDSELQRLAETSCNQLLLSENQYGSMADNSFSELARVCHKNIKCLQAISEASNTSRQNDRHTKQIHGLTERWESLSLRVEEAQKINAIHHEMATMKLEFCTAIQKLMSYRIVLDESHVIENHINKIENELIHLRNRKAAMLGLNITTHRLIMDLSQQMSPTIAALKDEVAELYRLWDEAFQKGNQQLCTLQAVQQFTIRLKELQCALQRDKDTLAVLDAALKAGATIEVASSVRDVARLLSEKHEVTDKIVVPDEITTEVKPNMNKSDNTVKLPFNGSVVCSLVGLEGGSLSDSGISDSGSDQELSVRERRLAVLRKLTRSLESQLVLDSDNKVLNELWRRIEETESELRTLQRQCRELIVKTAASVKFRSNVWPNTAPHYHILSKRKKQPHLKPIILKSPAQPSNISSSSIFTDDHDNPSISHNWVWRILRTALPLQLALVVLLCAACLLEPHCCEGSNSLNLSLTPQLRYVRGPPPV